MVKKDVKFTLIPTSCVKELSSLMTLTSATKNHHGPEPLMLTIPLYRNVMLMNKFSKFLF